MIDVDSNSVELMSGWSTLLEPPLKPHRRLSVTGARRDDQSVDEVLEESDATSDSKYMVGTCTMPIISV